MAQPGTPPPGGHYGPQQQGWYQAPDGRWYQQQGAPYREQTRPWSPGRKLKVGLIVGGIAFLMAGLGNLLYAISANDATPNYPGLAFFGEIIAALSSFAIGAALLFIAYGAVRE